MVAPTRYILVIENTEDDSTRIYNLSFFEDEAIRMANAIMRKDLKEEPNGEEGGYFIDGKFDATFGCRYGYIQYPDHHVNYCVIDLMGDIIEYNLTKEELENNRTFEQIVAESNEGEN